MLEAGFLVEVVEVLLAGLAISAFDAEGAADFTNPVFGYRLQVTVYSLPVLVCEFHFLAVFAEVNCSR